MIAWQSSSAVLPLCLKKSFSTNHRAVAEKQEHMRQWAEDVDALRAQLVAERRAWESDRSELEEIVAELEDEVKDLKLLCQYLLRTSGVSGTAGLGRGGGFLCFHFWARSRAQWKLRVGISRFCTTLAGGGAAKHARFPRVVCLCSLVPIPSCPQILSRKARAITRMLVIFCEKTANSVQRIFFCAKDLLLRRFQVSSVHAGNHARCTNLKAELKLQIKNTPINSTIITHVFCFAAFRND